MSEDLVKELPLGACRKHGLAKIDIDGEQHCLACDAAEAAAAVRPHGVVRIEDPGPEAMKDLKTAEAENFEHSREDSGLLPVPHVSRPKPAPTKSGGTFEQQVGAAVAALQACPMPKDLKVFKAVAKARAILENLIAPAQE